MIEIRYKFRGQSVTLDDIPSADQAVFSAMGNKIFEVADRLDCTNVHCKEKTLTATVGVDEPTVEYVCHPEYLNKINSELPDYLQLRVQNPSS